jgi:hypothetical protein
MEQVNKNLGARLQEKQALLYSLRVGLACWVQSLESLPDKAGACCGGPVIEQISTGGMVA